VSKKEKWEISFKTVKIPLLLIIIFYSIAFWRYSATGKIFFIYNFVYIGTALALGGFLNVSVLFCMRTCKLRDFSSIYLQEYLQQLPYIIL